MTAADWHMAFLKSWRFIVVIICFVLTAPISIFSFQVGSTAFNVATFLKEPVEHAEFLAEEARVSYLAARENEEIGDTMRQQLFAHYNTYKNEAQQLKLARTSNFLLGLTLMVSAVCSLLLIPLAVLMPIRMKLATIASQGIFVLLRIKLYATYVLFAALVIGAAGQEKALDLYGTSVGVQGMGGMSALVYLLLVVLVFYILVLRNVALIAADIAKAMRTDKFPGAFGLSCGLTWQGIVMMSICLFILMVLLFALIVVSLTVPGELPAMLAGASAILPALGGGWWFVTGALLWLLLSAGKFAAIAWCYPHYIRLSQEMKGCAADVLVENTPANATPVYYRRK